MAALSFLQATKRKHPSNQEVLVEVCDDGIGETRITVRDFLIANCIKTFSGLHKGVVVSGVVFSADKFDLATIWLKLHGPEFPKKKMKPSPLLQFLHRQSINRKLTAIIDKVQRHLGNLDFAKYQYTIFEARDIPDLIVFEQCPKDIIPPTIYDNHICRLFIHGDTILENFSEREFMRF